MLLKRQNKSEEPGIIQVFKMKQSAKIRKTGVHLIFLAVPKKGAPATYYKYEDLKESHPHFLFDFFEKKITTKSSSQIVQQVEKEKSVVVPPPQQKKQKRQTSRETKEIRESREIRELKDRKEVKQVIKEKEKEPIVKFMHERQYYKESISRQKEQRQANQVQSSKQAKESGQTRPIRSCRYRNDLKKRDQFQQRQEARQSIKNFSEDDPRSDPQDEEEQENDEEEYRRKSYKRIIDYDGLMKEQGKYEIVSPAVIPTAKAKNDVPAPSSIKTMLHLKDSEREQLSSEEFKESQESQFILDDRGKQRRRKDRMAKEQERFNKKRKSKKLKKKKKSGSRP